MILNKINNENVPETTDICSRNHGHYAVKRSRNHGHYAVKRSRNHGHYKKLRK